MTQEPSDTQKAAVEWVDGCGKFPVAADRDAQRYYLNEWFEGEDDGLFAEHVETLLKATVA